MGHQWGCGTGGVWYHGTTPYHHPSSVMIGVVPWYRTSGKTGFGVEKAFKLSKYAKYHLCTYFHFKNHMLSGSSSHHFFWNISSLSNTSNLLARGLYLNVNFPFDCPQTFPKLVFDYELWICCLDTEKWPKTNNNLLTQNKNYHPLEGVQRTL